MQDYLEEIKNLKNFIANFKENYEAKCQENNENML